MVKNYRWLWEPPPPLPGKVPWRELSAVVAMIVLALLAGI